MTAPITTDQLGVPTATALRDCLREQAALTSIGPVTAALVRHGAAGAPTMDGCDCTGTDEQGRDTQGIAYVRVTGVAPADLRPSGGGQRPGTAGGFGGRRCGVAWVVTYDLGLLRCYPLTEDGKPLPTEQAEQIAIRLASDRVALQRAIDCCDYLDRHSGTELVAFNAVGPVGGCAGWSATIRVRQVRG